jgi:hypothetical protein
MLLHLKPENAYPSAGDAVQAETPSVAYAIWELYGPLSMHVTLLPLAFKNLAAAEYCMALTMEKT